MSGVGLVSARTAVRAEKTLANGLRVVVERDATAPVATVCTTFAVGSRHEDKGATGLAHLFEHLMFAGTDRVGPGEHDRAMQSVGAQYNAMTTAEWTTYYDTVPVAALPLALWLEADRIHGLAAALDAAKLDSERDVVKNERRQTIDNVPFGSSSELITELLFPEGHPYRHPVIGSMQDLDRQSLEDIRRFFRKHYVPGNASLAVVGHVDPSETLALVERYFGSVPVSDVPATVPATRLGPIAPTPERVVLDEPTPVPAVILAWRLPPDLDPLVDACDIALTVLCGGEASRLKDRLVRGRELLVEVGAEVVRMAHAESFGLLHAFLPPGRSAVFVERVLGEELAQLAEEGPTEAELARAVAVAERAYLDSVSTFEGRAMALGRSIVLHGRADAEESYPDRIRAVTPSAVRDAARILTLDHAARIVYPATNSRSAPR